MYRKNRWNSSLSSHSKHTSVPADIHQKSTVWSMLATWSHCWRCTLINSRAAQNVFAATVNGTQNRKAWITVLPKFLKQRDITLQRKAILQKLLQVTLHTVYLRSFTVLASCKSVSVLVTKTFDNQHAQGLCTFKSSLWVQCNTCSGWYHCACAGTTHKKAGESDFVYTWHCTDC